MLQLMVLDTRKRALRLPTKIECLKIDPQFHKSVMDQALTIEDGVPVIYDKQTKKLLSGGVEIKNVKVTITSRGKDRQVPVLEEYRFVPYYEGSILTETDKEKLETYIQICSSLAKKILVEADKFVDKMIDPINEFKEADNVSIECYLKSCTSNHVLLKFLAGLMNISKSNDFEQLAKISFCTYLTERDHDILSQTMLQENPLRTVLDVVVENAGSKKLKVAEIADSTLPLSFTFNDFFQRNNQLNISYLIAHSKSEIFDESDLPSANFDLLPWDPKSSLSSDDFDLIAMKFLNRPTNDYREILTNATSALKDNGFLLLVQRTLLTLAERIFTIIGKGSLEVFNETGLEKIFTDLQLQVICKKSDSLTSTLYLLRKPGTVSYVDTIIPIIEYKYEKWVDELSRQMATGCSDDKKRVWLVSEGAENSGIIGLVNCLKNEPGGSNIRCVFTCKETSRSNPFSLKNIFYQEVARKNLTMNVCCKGSWGSFRHITIKENFPKVETGHAYLNFKTKGDLSSFEWVDSPIKYLKHQDNSKLCQVYYAPLNFRDVLLASGKLTVEAMPGEVTLDDCYLGIEFSGRMENGQRVMGLVPNKGLATTVMVDPDFLWEVPEDWSLEEASTVPAAYSTVFYALIMRGNLTEGERVLIHSGSGGVGQAAIAVCLSLGCEVFTSVGSSIKKEFLKKRFRQLQDRNFCFSRDTSFEQYILNETNGEGVDVILNSLAEEKFKATLNCLSKSGRFLEIGKYDMVNDTSLGMSVFLKNISFVGILLDLILEDPMYIEDRKEINNLLKDGIANGTVKPLDTTLFEYYEAEDAFRFMASGKHVGKVVIKIRDGEPQKMIKPTPVQLEAVSRITCNPESSYVIVGGLGGLGLELCQWLVDRGARHIILASPSGIKTGYQKLCLNKWKEGKINVHVSKLNAAQKDEAKALLKMAADIKPVTAIFNLATVLRDALMENQTVEKFKEACDAKISSTLNLDASSRELCPQLEWFVCFSSLAAAVGNAGQTIYAYANSAIERICEHRKQEGYPGLAIQWGVIGDVGVSVDKLGQSEYENLSGSIPQSISSCLTVLEKLLQQQHPVVSSFVPYEPSVTVTHKETKRSSNVHMLNL